MLLGLPPTALMLVWAVHDGGYDTETWSWGALLILALTAAGTVMLAGRSSRLSRPGRLAIGFFALYVAWSYLSITWAQSPGDALQGSNRALLYLLLFSLMLIAPWTRASALTALLGFAGGIGVIAIVLLLRFASQDNVAGLITGGRLSAPTGYFNATAALFTIGALLGTVLALRRELPGLVRGLLLAFACAELQLAVIVQSRGWLFTLPIVLLLAAALSVDRLRLALIVLVPTLGVAPIAGRLLDVFSSAGTSVGQAEASAGEAGLLACATVFVIGTIAAWTDWLLRDRVLSSVRRRVIGSVLCLLAAATVLGGGTVATHGHPVRFVVRQWNGFSHRQQAYSSHSHFGDVGSGRYDYWRVSLDAFRSNPIGGIGQDNFASYYIQRGRSGEEPSWTHSLEMRLLAHTGLVGSTLFLAFIGSALLLALRGRRRGSASTRGLIAAAVIPLVVWLVHGSIDWFWEMPALSGPALGFLGLAGSLATRTPAAVTGADDSLSVDNPRGRSRRRIGLGAVAAVVATIAGAIVLGLPYLSVREVSLASDVAATNPSAALADLQRAASLNPLSPVPGRLGGAIALQNGEYGVATERFRQSLARDPGGWFSWLGAGLATSALGDRKTARSDFAVAYRINRNQPANRAALDRVGTPHPLTYAEAQELFVVHQ